LNSGSQEGIDSLSENVDVELAPASYAHLEDKFLTTILEDTNTTTGELTKSNSSGTTTFTVVTAGDYLFTITSTGVSVQIQ
jgi:hypothetical protein